MRFSVFAAALVFLSIPAFSQTTNQSSLPDAVAQQSTAAKDLERATSNADARLAKTADYQSAKSALDAASAVLDTARQTGTAQEKIDASGDWNKKRQKLEDMRQAFLNNDPDYADAKRAYDDSVLAVTKIKAASAISSMPTPVPTTQAAEKPKKLKGDTTHDLETASNLEKDMTRDAAEAAMGRAANKEEMDNDGTGVLTWIFLTPGSGAFVEPRPFGEVSAYFTEGKIVRIVKVRY